MNLITQFEVTKCRQSANLIKQQRSKIAFGLRCFVLFTVVLVFFIKYLLASQLMRSTSYEVVDDAYLVSHKRSVRSVQEDGLTLYAENDTSDIQTTNTRNCTYPGINEFPSDGLTRSDRKHGWILLHLLLAMYCFWLLAVICDEYFMPALELICANLNLQKDVIGATIMAAATSSPELFMNIIGTFVTEGDIGVGAIVGSSVFNILAVPACCGLFVANQIQLHWWSLSRDCSLYCITVLGLIATLYDGRIMWYEALLLFLGYFVYLLVMSYNDILAASVKSFIYKHRRRPNHVRGFREVSELTPLLYCHNNKISSKFSLASELYEDLNAAETSSADNKSEDSSIDTTYEVVEYAVSPWNCDNSNWFAYLLRWPITTILWLTIPDSKKYPKWKHVTLLISIAWIALASFLVAFVITIIGDTLDIPDSIMGLTVLAAGMSLPEAVSSIIVTKQGQGAMGISNSIGSNTFSILLCLSFPWFIKATFMPAVPDEHWITINSSGLTYSVIFLLASLFGLFIAFALNKFVLDRRIGMACTLMYASYLVIATLMELNFFFPVNLPMCEH